MRHARIGAGLLAALLCAGLGCAHTKGGGAANAAQTPAPEVAALAAATESPEAHPPQDADGALRVLFINVGKADAALVSCGGRNVLIDTGTKASAARLVGALSCMGVSRLDAVFLTHTHSDHVGGLTALSRHVPIDRLYAAAISENKKNGENKITELADECGLPLTRLRAGDTLPLSDEAVFTVLGPLTMNAADDNDNSLVLGLSAFGRVVLFTGDMQFAEEDTLLAGERSLRADVLKVGNHGNPDATSDAFGAAVSPSIAVISTDTREDDDSANPRVYAALPDADIRVTEDTDVGVLLTVTPAGALLLSEPARLAGGERLTITAVDMAAQTVTLRNDGDALDIGGFLLLSERGGELFRFPEGSALAAGQAVVIAAEGGRGDYTFTGETAPWNRKKGDTAILYDRFGRELARS